MRSLYGRRGLSRHYITHKDGDPLNVNISNLEIRPMAQPVVPNVSAEQYAADREAVNVINSMARIVQIGPFKFRVTASDWPDVKSAETAASMLAAILHEERHNFGVRSVNDILDDLGERIRREMGVDDSRPLGMCFTAEPL